MGEINKSAEFIVYKLIMIQDVSATQLQGRNDRLEADRFIP